MNNLKSGIYKHNIRFLERNLFGSAKLWHSISLATRIISFLFSIASILFSFLSKSSPFVTIALSITADIFLWRSDNYKSAAEALHRKLDFMDSFGWQISKLEVADILANLPDSVAKKAENNHDQEPFFASTLEPGPKKALDNLKESTWWSKHLSNTMLSLYSLVTFAFISLSIIILIVSIVTINNFDILSTVGRIVTSAISLVFSLGLIKTTYGYYKFNNKSTQVESQIKSLEMHNLEIIDVIKLWHDYQLARASSPMIPTVIWLMKRKKLNSLWNEYQS
ncbi:hypothetical protein [Herpetosiphon geysericola]|uniref:Uncharacterized protein n=1 Tax=Herpetosiphon geysericola TaxID=70996 RepID=A0A0N8GPD8_9CHLR|nr:hypothetical protein [Herpetosiphon geysericola]KPL80618.1 hypothetical protein SE18_23670 [Herpetosiphon geysericola]